MSDTQLTLKKGESKTLTFSSSSDSGYLWNADVDDKDIVSVSKLADANPSGIMKPGHSNDELYKVEALKEGNTQITFRQQRNWEDTPVKTEVYKVTVE